MSIDSLKLLHDISNFQESQQPDQGLFLSNRYHAYLPINRKDNNLFFTSSIILILDLISDDLNSEEKSLLESMRSKAISALEAYCRKENPNEYNFWKTGNNKHFPGSIILSRLRFFQLPFDLDSSTVTYKILGRSSEEVSSLQNKMIQHANTIKGWNKTSLVKYQQLPLYSSWFGEKMPIEIDLCVICNILTLILTSKIKLNKCDHACIDMITSVIKDGEYFDHAFTLSPAYPNSAVILYHISRLLALSETRSYFNCKQKLISDLHLAKESSEQHFEMILIDLSIAKLTGQKAIRNEELIKAVYNSSYPWFTAGFLSAFSSPVLKLLAPYPLFHMKFSCIAFTNTILFEYLKFSE